MEYILNDPAETAGLGGAIAKNIKPGKKAAVIGLSGSLGAGKTTFIQGFGQGLGIKDKILSPTFVIMNRYPLKGQKFDNFYHFDCYQIEDEEEMKPLGFKEIIADPGNIICIEWPEKIRKLLPEGMISIDFKISGENGRRVILKEHGEQ
jgi:tRNA threonylcarbamoyladenosine biosynthesis protein TsaE